MAVSPAFKKVLGDYLFKLLEDRPVLNDFKDFGINIRNYRTVNVMRIIWVIVEVDNSQSASTRWRLRLVVLVTTTLKRRSVCLAKLQMSSRNDKHDSSHPLMLSSTHTKPPFSQFSRTFRKRSSKSVWVQLEWRDVSFNGSLTAL